MDTNGGKRKQVIWVVCCLLISALFAALVICTAYDHTEAGQHYVKHSGRSSSEGLGRFFGGGHDKGNETTGQIVAWSLAAANLTVALSLLLRGVTRFVPIGPELKKTLVRCNNTQKKLLMKWHYFLNPLILILAVLHWTLSRCRSTALPEWGLLTMASLVLLGITLKFKLCPKPFVRNVYRLHTQPIFFLLFISMLFIGHLSMD